MLTDTVYEWIREERDKQDIQWGGSLHDDLWTPLDWYEMVADYNAWARRKAAMEDYDQAIERYVQVAALAVAAIECLDRKRVSIRRKR